MQSSPFAEKAIPMVAVNQDTGKYEMTEQAFKFLRAIQGPIAVVSVAGLYRTGKSYLLNRVLLNRSNGFGVGPTVNPCTKGLWCWGTPIKGQSSDGEQVNIIVIDTQGIGALDQDQTHDTKIFTLAILASSCFIYNSVGSIDQNAIQNLSLVVNLTKHIQLKAGGQDEDGEDPDQIASYFPSFYWVVRDFSLQLQDAQGNSINSKEYLERALAPQNGFSDDVEQKNRIRRLLTAFFKDRDCFTMIRPLVDQQKLQLLDKLDYDQLRPEFVDQAMKFRKRIISGIKVKTLQNQKLNGQMYCSMINSYVNAINQGAVPNIQNAWSYMCEEQCRKTFSECCQIFDGTMEKGFEQFPKSEEDFNKVTIQAEEKALQAFREKALGDKSINFLKDLKGLIRKQIGEERERNIKASHEVVKEYIMKNVTPLKKKLSSQQFKSFSDFDKEVNAIFEKLLNDGPKLHGYKYVFAEAHRKFSTQGADFLFKNFTKSMDKNTELFKEKEKQMTTELESLRTQSDTFRNKYKESTMTADQQISELSYKLQNLKSQLELTTKSKMEEEAKMKQEYVYKQSEFQSGRKSLQQKLKDLMNKLDQSNKQYNQDRKRWETDRVVLEQKNKLHSNAIEELQRKERSLDSTLNISKLQASQQVREMTQRHENQLRAREQEITQLKDKMHERQEELATVKQELQSKSDKLQKREKKYKDDMANSKKDMEQMKKKFETEKKQLRDELDQINDKTSAQSESLQSRIKEYERTIKIITDQTKKIKIQMEGDKMLAEQNQEFTKEQINNLKRQNTQLKDTIDSLKTQYEDEANMKREVSQLKRTEELKADFAREKEEMLAGIESQRKRSLFELNNMTEKCRDFETQYKNTKSEFEKTSLQLRNNIDQLTDEIRYLKNQQKIIESESYTEISKIRDELESKLREAEQEIEQNKEKHDAAMADQMKLSEDTIAHIKNNFQIEKVNLQKKIASEKQKAERRYNLMVEDSERRLTEQIEPLESEIQQLREDYNNLQQTFKITTGDLQHELDISRKRAENLQKNQKQLKQTLTRKQIDFNIKLQNMSLQTKAEKEKLQSKIQLLVNQNNKKDKDLMSTTHHRDQLANTLQKKQDRLNQLETDIQTQKQNYVGQIQKLHFRVSEMEKEHYDKITTHVKENALLTQENVFNSNKIKELQKNIETSNQVYEEKMNRYKQEKDEETKIQVDRLTQEKQKMENKYKEFKTAVKDAETMAKKQINDLVKDKGVLEEKISNTELKLQELEQKRSIETRTLQTELDKVRQNLSVLKKSSEAQMAVFRDQVEKLDAEKTEISSKAEKDCSLYLQKIKFLQNSKEENKKDSEDRIRRLETEMAQLRNRSNSDKNSLDSIHIENLRKTQEKYRLKITELNEQLSRKNYEYETSLKQKMQQIKELMQKYQMQRNQRENSTVMYDKKIGELTQNERRLRQQVDRLKFDKEKREIDYRRREKEEKDAFKVKMASLEVRLKESEMTKTNCFFQYEKERTKWTFEKQNYSERINNLTDTINRLDREKDKNKAQIQKLKNQRKNSTKTHTYISGLKTYYQPMKQQIQEQNKQNQTVNE